MKSLFVIDRKEDWPSGIPGAEIVPAEEYLTDSAYNHGRYQGIVNLCSCDRHQGKGQYVSLVAEARGQHVIPSVKTIEDVHSGLLLRLLPREIDSLLQASLPRSGEQTLEVDACFGHDPTGRHATVSRRLFELVKAPFLRARFQRTGNSWQLSAITALESSEIPARHRSDLIAAAQEIAAGHSSESRLSFASGPPSVAILHDGPQTDSPSNDRALERFVTAARTLEMRAEIVDRHAVERLATFDALFIRDTTNPGHYTYEFARRAAAAGLVVIDDPDSILQCNNKVYLHELLERHHVPMPKSTLVHRDNIDEVAATLAFPCILKEPGSAFSRGVTKVESASALTPALKRLLEKSDLIIDQTSYRRAAAGNRCVREHHRREDHE